MVILGAAQYDGRPSIIFRSRLLEGARAYPLVRPTLIVVSGGQQSGDRFSEGDAGRRFLIRLGVPAGRVVAETQASNTVENLRNSQAWLTGGPVTLVTDSVHASRALALARSLGLRASVLSAAYPGDPAAFLRYAARESLATAVYAIIGPVSSAQP